MSEEIVILTQTMRLYLGMSFFAGQLSLVSDACVLLIIGNLQRYFRSGYRHGLPNDNFLSSGRYSQPSIAFRLRLGQVLRLYLMSTS